MDGTMIAGMYDLEETLGTGHFAVVKLARHVITGDHVAVKVIDKTKLDKQARDHLFQEVRCMKLVQHPSIIRLYQVIDTQSKLYLILELGENGDLYEYISKHSGGVGEDESHDLFRQIVEAIAYCHRLHVVHRDLKPENVVFCDNAARVKLTDFGLSNLFAPGEKLKTSCGSLSYAAPEILLGDMYDAPAVDLWSLGVILYMLLVGEKPFVGGTDSETLTMIMDCKFEMPSHLSPESVDLVKNLLVADPKERLSIEDVFNHPWMQRYSNTSPTNSTSSPPPVDLRTQIDADDRQHIIKTMVDRGVADVDTINKSLDSNTYDHIAATYYLMAEAHYRKKEDLFISQVSGLDLERLDRRRRRVRKLSVPGSPGGRVPDSRTRMENGVTSPLARPVYPIPTQCPIGPGLDAYDSSMSSSPGRRTATGAAEVGVLRPARRSMLVATSCPGQQTGPHSLSTTPDAAPVGRSLRRASLTHKLHSSRPDDQSGITTISGPTTVSGTLHFTLPPLFNMQTSSSPEEQSPSNSTDTTPRTSLTPARSLVQIEEQGQDSAGSVPVRVPGTSAVSSASSSLSPDTPDGPTLGDLTLTFSRLPSDPPDSPVEPVASTPTRGGMYPNWLTGHQGRSRTSAPYPPRQPLASNNAYSPFPSARVTKDLDL